MNSKSNQKNLLDEIADAIPNERGGSPGSAGYDYQKAWAIIKILDLYQTQNNFIVILDYHEDVIVLDSPELPTTVKFYQIKKKKNGNWTPTLLTQKKDTILEKLLCSSEKIPSGEKHYYFSSNAPLSIKLIRDKINSTDLEKISFSEVHDDEIKKIFKKLQKINSKKILSKERNHIVYEKCRLSPESYADACIGKIAVFFEEQRPACNVKANSFYKTFFEVVRKKTNYERLATQKDILISEKTISRNDFEELLKKADSITAPPDCLSPIITSLEGIHYPVKCILKIKDYWKDFYLDMKGTNLLIHQLRKRIKEIIRNTTKNDLEELIKDCLQKYKENRLESIFDDDYLTLVIVHEYRY